MPPRHFLWCCGSRIQEEYFILFKFALALYFASAQYFSRAWEALISYHKMIQSFLNPNLGSLFCPYDKNENTLWSLLTFDKLSLSSPEKIAQESWKCIVLSDLLGNCDRRIQILFIDGTLYCAPPPPYIAFVKKKISSEHWQIEKWFPASTIAGSSKYCQKNMLSFFLLNR